MSYTTNEPTIWSNTHRCTLGQFDSIDPCKMGTTNSSANVKLLSVVVVVSMYFRLYAVLISAPRVAAVKTGPGLTNNE